MPSSYVELHCHSNYSFQEGASFPDELLERARHLGYSALALTDHDNLTIALEFADRARQHGIKPIVGAEVTLLDGHHLTLLAESQCGYKNLSTLLSYAHIRSERRDPRMDPEALAERSDGLIVLSGCSKGQIPSLLAAGKLDEAQQVASRYLDVFGETGSFFLELQQNLAFGDTARNRRLIALGKNLGIPLVATNNVHYHVRQRHRLHDALVAVKNLKSLEESHRERRANSEFHLKSPEEMANLFVNFPEAIQNTSAIAERCTSFDLRQHLGYEFPEYETPGGIPQLDYLRRICEQAARRKYGSIDQRIRDRLEEELRRIGWHNLAGFFLIYYDIIQMAREVMLDLGLGDPEVPLEENPPGRGRGSSVAMLVGYLIGLSHIDPLKFDLGLDRFLPKDGEISAPDIDLDFPRNIREELILRVHARYGWEKSALVGAISTYQVRGVIRDLGKALSLPPDQVDRLAKRMGHHDGRDIRREMSQMSEFRHLIDAPGWRDLLELAPQLANFPRLVQQHSGGMVISSTPLIEIVPVMHGAIDGRYVMQWDKDSVSTANMVKIDFLALGTLSQMQEAVRLIEQEVDEPLDLSRIDIDDQAVYGSLHRADTVGIFQVESAAQMQTIPRLRPTNLHEMAFEVAAVRPGVGANDGITHFIRRYREDVDWGYDHPLEEQALERTLGIILFQDQVNEVAIHVAGFSPREADLMRRDFGKRGNKRLLADWQQRFLEGAARNQVSTEVAERIFWKFNGQYMFPEAHAYAFGFTAYQMAWLKFYHPLEFYTGLFNEQPMGFWSPETIKEDAKHHGIPVLNPDANRSKEKALIEGKEIRLGFSYIQNMGAAHVANFVQERQRKGPYSSVPDVVRRTELPQVTLESLTEAGAFDSLNPDRRATKWEIGLLHRVQSGQLQLDLSTGQDMATLPSQTHGELLSEEYKSLGMAPSGHAMQEFRGHLPPEVIPSYQLDKLNDGDEALVAGRVIRRQRPGGRTVFITLEDEYGFIPLIIWQATWLANHEVLRNPYLLIKGKASRREGTLNIVVEEGRSLGVFAYATNSKDWH